MHLARTWPVLAIALALATALAAGRARADLLRCTGPDGRTIYTDDKSLCPDSARYEPSGAVHSVDSAAPGPEPEADTRKARAARRVQVQDARAGEARRWRDRKQAKEEELRQVVAERDALKGWVAFCNHGNIVFTRDEAGIKERVHCSELSGRLAALDARAAGIRDYLENELPEECRRSGCLPGWIR
jgi:hypothetical protein